MVVSPQPTQIGEPWMCAGNRFLGYAMEYLPGMFGKGDPLDNRDGGWSLLQDWISKEHSEVDLGQVREAAKSQLKRAHEISVDFGPNSYDGSTGVHGDLRPCNIAVRHYGDPATVAVSFLDFGFAGLAPNPASVPMDSSSVAR
jgi:serine/threonine protein kinase